MSLPLIAAAAGVAIWLASRSASADAASVDDDLDAVAEAAARAALARDGGQPAPRPSQPVEPMPRPAQRPVMPMPRPATPTPRPAVAPPAAAPTRLSTPTMPRMRTARPRTVARATAPSRQLRPNANPHAARALAPRVATNIAQRRSAYDRGLLRQFQAEAGLVVDGLYGGGSAGALRYYLEKPPPRPLFRPTTEKAYSPYV